MGTTNLPPALQHTRHIRPIYNLGFMLCSQLICREFINISQITIFVHKSHRFCIVHTHKNINDDF